MKPGVKTLAASSIGLVGGAVLVIMLVGYLSGTFAAPRFVDAGAFVRWARPMAIVVTQLAGSVTIGALAGAAFLAPQGLRPAFLRIAAVASALWTIALLARLILTYANLSAVKFVDPTFGGGFADFTFRIGLGQGIAVMIGASALVTILSLGVRNPAPIAWTGVVALVPFGAQAQIGHAAGAANHTVAVSAMFIHLVAAALWIGLLFVLLLVREERPMLARRYSVVAAWCALAIVVSGLANSLLRIGSLRDLHTGYGMLLIAKVMVTMLLLGCGWLHRMRTLPQLERRPRDFVLLALGELATMGMVSGLAVVLANSAPPIPQDPPTGLLTAAQRVTGEVLPPEPTFFSWFFAVSPDVLFGFLTAIAAVMYMRWAARLRRRGDPWSRLRQISWLTGLAIFAWATNGGPALYGKVLFSAHMIEHMMLVMVVPVFLTLAAPVTLAVRALPSREDDSRGPREWLLAVVQSRWGKLFANPIFAAVNFAGSMVVFYFSPAFEFALRNHIGHIAMVVHFTFAGYLFVNAMVGVDPGPRRPSYPLRIVLLFATMAFHAFFGVAIMGGQALLAPDWFGLLGRPWGPSALADQQIGGAITWGIGELPTLAIAIAVAVSWSRDDKRIARRFDRAALRDGDAEMIAYNRMLADLARADAGESSGGGPGDRPKSFPEQ